MPGSFVRSGIESEETTKYIKNLIEEIDAAVEGASITGASKREEILKEVQKEIISEEKKARLRLEKEIAEFRLKHILENIDEEAAYERATLVDQQLNLLRKKLDTQRFISKQAERDRKKEEEVLKRELEIQRLKNSSNSSDNAKARRMEEVDAFKEVFKKSFKDFSDAVKSPGKEVGKVFGEDLKKVIKGVGKAIEDGLNAINQSITKYAQYQTAINTRLQGTSNFSKVSKNLGSVAFSPLINASNLYENLNSLVSDGIAYNVEQRAFLMTIKDSIATTFDANADYMKRIIRIQQEDSTAARLGMESYLTRWLNEYIKNTEYLTTTFDTVAASLMEASTLLRANGVAGMSEEFEYIVQKWLGVLTGVGLSDSTASQIAEAIGALGSGDVSGLGSGIYNLLTMASSRSGIELGSILNYGADADEINQLLYGMTGFLQDLSSTSSNVVKNQLAKTFGVTVSDLIAASNLQGELDKISRNAMSRNYMYEELNSQMGSIKERIGISNILENLFSNFTFQTGMNIASNPATYALWKITDLIQGVTGGINIPFVSTLGNGLDLNTTVENLMKLGIVGVSTFSNIGKITSGLSSLGDGASLLKALEISSDYNPLKRGTGISDYVGIGATRKRVSSVTRSANTYIGEENADAYQDASLTTALEDAKVNADTDDKAVTQTYLSDLLYMGDDAIGKKVKEIASDINSIRNNGISVNKLGNIDEDLAGFFTQLHYGLGG